MDPELLDLPLGVKIPVLPGSKPVFSRAKLGEKVKEVERGGKALFFYGVPVIQRSPCGHLLYSGSRSPKDSLAPLGSAIPFCHQRELPEEKTWL